MPNDFDPDAVLDAMAPQLGLTIADAYRPGVRLHLENTARIAAGLLTFDLDDDVEPAPVFTA